MAPSYTVYISKRSGMGHTVLPANTPCLPFLRKRSPDGATPNWSKRHLIAAYYSSIDPEEMKGWVGLVGWRWPIADGLSGHSSATRRAQDRESSPAKDRRSTTVPRNQLPRVATAMLRTLTANGRRDASLRRIFRGRRNLMWHRPGVLSDPFCSGDGRGDCPCV